MSIFLFNLNSMISVIVQFYKNTPKSKVFMETCNASKRLNFNDDC